METAEFYTEKLKKMGYPTEEIILIGILLTNSLRISEICNCNNIRVMSDLSLQIYQPKTNCYRTGTVAIMRDECRKILKSNGKLNWNRNRQYYWRLFKKIGISSDNTDRKNQAVTHAARYERAQELFRNDAEPQAIANALGHKGIVAQRFYTLEKKPKKKISSGILGYENNEMDPVILTKKGIIRIRK